MKGSKGGRAGLWYLGREACLWLKGVEGWGAS